MTTNTIALTKEQMHSIARYDITFKDLAGKLPFENVDFEAPDEYIYTLDDLYHVLINLKEKNPTIHDFGSCWFYPVTQLGDSFGLDKFYGTSKAFENEAAYPDEYPDLKITDGAYFSDIWQQLEDAWEDYEDNVNISSALDLDKIISDLEQYFSNKGKPLTEWAFPDEDKENFIAYFDSDKFLEEASDESIALCRKMTEEMCSEGNTTALRVKGYACYGGNRLYPCDWSTSRDCMLQLFEKTGDPGYANTLGYIYYYGRCNNGTPEYDKAFAYFSISAACGLYEGTYKLGDMFLHGYGCIQSSKAARSLYTRVYNETKWDFTFGKNNMFADAALRMGNIYSKGIAERIDIPAAYYYYLQADYASTLRLKESTFFGYQSVAENIKKALKETRRQLPEGYFKSFADFDDPRLLYNMAHYAGHPCIMTLSRQNKRWIITAEMPAPSTTEDPAEMLITVPEVNYCRLTDKVSVELSPNAEVSFQNHKTFVFYNNYKYDYTNYQYEFYLENEITAHVKTDYFRFYGEHAETANTPEYLIAEVRFTQAGKVYSYISDIPDIQIGDKVVVNGFDGEREATVSSLELKSEAELDLPVERYKKIIRRVN